MGQKSSHNLFVWLKSLALCFGGMLLNVRDEKGFIPPPSFNFKSAFSLAGTRIRGLLVTLFESGCLC